MGTGGRSGGRIHAEQPGHGNLRRFGLSPRPPAACMASNISSISWLKAGAEKSVTGLPTSKSSGSPMRSIFLTAMFFPYRIKKCRLATSLTLSGTGLHLCPQPRTDGLDFFEADRMGHRVGFPGDAVVVGLEQ